MARETPRRCGAVFEYEIGPGRKISVQVEAGKCLVAGYRVEAGDGIAIREEVAVELIGAPDMEVLIFDLR